MRRATAVAILLLRFFWQVLLSGFTTARIVVRLGPPPPAGLIRMEYAPMSAAGTVLLGCMVTLTPGTTVIDIDSDRHEMLLHLLDLTNAEATVASIRQEFERHLTPLFGLPED
jgi:multicomponent K+:H+ antiporter subunit E/multicomponent Na+:H+ antiporter subunit E